MPSRPVRVPWQKQVEAPRIRGRKLQTLRSNLFRDHPFCELCKVRVAVERDHIISLAKGGPDTEDNVQALCIDCHAEKTAVDLGWRPRDQIGLDGWPISKT